MAGLDIREVVLLKLTREYWVWGDLCQKVALNGACRTLVCILAPLFTLYLMERILCS